MQSRVLERRMNHLIASDRAENTRFAFLLLDLDQFKIINDSLGHHSGDMLLQRLSPKLRAAVRKTDIVARLGGDEFAILLPGATAEEAILVSKKIQKSLRTPMLINNHWLDIGASIGIAFTPSTAGLGKTFSSVRTSPCTRRSGPMAATSSMPKESATSQAVLT